MRWKRGKDLERDRDERNIIKVKKRSGNAGRKIEDDVWRSEKDEDKLIIEERVEAIAMVERGRREKDRRRPQSQSKEEDERKQRERDEGQRTKRPSWK